MLRLTGRQPVDTREPHERCFMDRYRELHARACRLVGGDSTLADDLVHDAYVQFVLGEPDLDEIENLDAYLAAMLRNLHIARLRRKSNQRQIHLPIEDFDSADLALAHTHPEHRLVTREALRRVCLYACARKTVWKGASAFILRFFHGFYPTEIDRIMHAPALTANRLVFEARAEARAVVAGEIELATVSRSGVVLPSLTSDDPAETLQALRHAIFLTRVPPCPAGAVVHAWYSDASGPLEASVLSHVVSCRSCLDVVCSRLGIPPLEERSPLDPSDPGAGGVAPRARRPRSFDRGVRLVEEHVPRQLQISVNGLPVGALSVTAPENAVRFTARLDEPLGFAELHSEQDVRMLWLTLGPVTERGLIQRARVSLANDRWIEMAVDFSSVHPTVSVTYADPSVPVRLADPSSDREPDWKRPRARPRHADPTESQVEPTRWWQRWLAWQPAMLIASVALMALAGAALWLRSNPKPIDPDTLTALAESREAAAPVPVDRAVHRTFSLEARDRDSGNRAIHRVESWLRGGSPVRATRVFDVDGRLVAGAWANEARQLTTRGGEGLGEWWQTDLSAAAFRERYMSLGGCTATTDAIVHTITCERPDIARLFGAVFPTVHARSTTPAPSHAALTLRRDDLHAIGLEIQFALDGRERIVRLVETGLRQMPLSDVPSTAFTPDLPRPVETSTSATRLRRPAVPILSLEVRVLEIVDRIVGGELITVRRANAGVAVTGLVGRAKQRRALTGAIDGLDAGRSVTVSVQTFAEAAARQGGGRKNRSLPTRVELREPAAGPAPMEHYLRTRLPPDADVGAVVARLAEEVLPEATRAREHVTAVVALLDRFPDDQRAGFDEPGRAAWRTLVDRHASACGTALDRLSSVLTQYLSDTSDLTPASTILSSAAHRLAHEVGALDIAVAKAFTSSGSAVPNSFDAGAPELLRLLRQAQADVLLIQTLARR